MKIKRIFLEVFKRIFKNTPDVAETANKSACGDSGRRDELNYFFSILDVTNYKTRQCFVYY